MCLRLQKHEQKKADAFATVAISSKFLAYPPTVASCATDLWTPPKAHLLGAGGAAILHWIVIFCAITAVASFCLLNIKGHHIEVIAQFLSAVFVGVSVILFLYAALAPHPFHPNERKRYVTLAKEKLR